MKPKARLKPIWLAVAVLIVFLVPTGVARLAGLWHSSISESEYRLRIPESDSPIYNHARGSAPADPREKR